MGSERLIAARKPLAEGPREAYGGVAGGIGVDPQPTVPFQPKRAFRLPSMGLAVKTHAAYTPSSQVLAAGVRVR